MQTRFPVFFFLQLIILAFVISIANGKDLKVGFYKKKCPNQDVEAIVKKVVDKAVSADPTIAAPLLRMHFHDCFVRGCDGSVLLNSSTNQAEKDAVPNGGLQRAFNIIDQVKTALEKACPKLVSCADIVALVARDATVKAKGPFWKVETGRRDGNVSNLSDALTNLPSPFSNITTLITDWQGKGLSVKDLVVLSGSHTIGISHCFNFNNRLYNFTGKGDTDPSLDPKYITKLKQRCKNGDQTTTVSMDPKSVNRFDDNYYTLVANKRGLMQSDSALLNNAATKKYVQRQAANHGSTFFNDFGDSMIRMGRIGVLTGTAGEIRNVCSKVN